MPETFKNIREVAKYLKGKGYKETERTIYNNKAKLGKKKDGIYTLAQVNRFARDWLTEKDDYDSKKVEEQLRDGRRAEFRFKDVQARKSEYELEILQGKHISKEEADRQLTAKAIALYSEIMGAFEMGVTEIVEIAGGEQKKAGEILKYLKDILDGAMNEYASGKMYEIEVETEI